MPNIIQKLIIKCFLSFCIHFMMVAEVYAMFSPISSGGSETHIHVVHQPSSLVVRQLPLNTTGIALPAVPVAELMVNMQYEYDDADINNLLLLRAQEMGLDLMRTILMPPLSNEGNQIGEHLGVEMGRNREVGARIILLPVNMYGTHWAGLVIRLDAANRVQLIQYIDPLGGRSDAIPDEIKESLQAVYGNCNIENLILLRQTDITACGVLTVENLLRAAQGQLETVIAHEEFTRSTRSHHIDLLELSRPDLHFHFKQENNANERGISGRSRFMAKVSPFLRLVEQFGEYYRQDNTSAKIQDPTSGITYEVLRPEDAEQAASVIARNFSDPNRGEPMSIRLNISNDEWKRFALSCSIIGAAEGLSLVARNERGEIVGAYISFDFTTPVPSPDSELKKKIDPLLKILDALDVHVPQHNVKNKYLHQFLVGIDKQHAGKSVLLLLALLNNEMGRVRGFQEAVVEPTGPISQHIFKHLDYKRIAGIGYDEFSYEGTIPFKNLYETFSVQTHEAFLRKDSRLTEVMIAMKSINLPLSTELNSKKI